MVFLNFFFNRSSMYIDFSTSHEKIFFLKSLRQKVFVNGNQNKRFFFFFNYFITVFLQTLTVWAKCTREPKPGVVKRSILTGPPQDTFSYIVHDIIVTIGIGTGSGEFSKTNSVPCTPNTWELRSGLDGFLSNSVFFSFSSWKGWRLTSIFICTLFLFGISSEFRTYRFWWHLHGNIRYVIRRTPSSTFNTCFFFTRQACSHGL